MKQQLNNQEYVFVKSLIGWNAKLISDRNQLLTFNEYNIEY